MKLKQKLLVGLLAVGFASGAQADIADANTGNGELFASVSNGLTSSAVFDLGFVLSSFLPSVVSTAAGTTYTWNLDTSVTSNSATGTTVSYGSVWDTFAATVTDWSTVTFDVAAMDSTGNTLGSDQYLSTSSDPTTLDLVAGVTNQNLGTWGGVIDNYIAQADLTDGGATNGASFANGIGSAVLFADGKGDTWQTKSPWISTQTVGTSADFYYISSTSNSNFASVNGELYAGTWLMDQNGLLTYSVAAPAVPEADTWAMFAAGLLAVGAIARRRMQS